jgi:hypothetical protein
LRSYRVRLNEELAFTEAERDSAHLRGLLPAVIAGQQLSACSRIASASRAISRSTSTCERCTIATRLFFRLLMDHPDEM